MPIDSITKIPIIILAAGSSSRLGSPKQLLEYQGETLLNRAIRLASNVSENVVVVLGANFNTISKTITNENCQIIFNENWSEGMATSIIKALEFYQDFEKIIISICDQPYLEAKVFRGLISMEALSKKLIIAANYGNQLGVPILFNRLIFKELSELKGDKGARAILPKYENEIAEVHFPKGEIDVDTIEDWENILKMAGN